MGQRVQTAGTWVPGDFIVVASRFNDDVEGYWVTGQLRVADRTSIAVAVGWAPDPESAEAAVEELEAAADGSEVEITGRIISDEGPRVPPHADPQRLDRMSPAALLSRWHDIEELDVYRPYLASTTATAGLVDISSPRPMSFLPSTGSTCSMPSSGPSSPVSRSTSGTDWRRMPGSARSRSSKTGPEKAQSSDRTRIRAPSGAQLRARVRR